ncbi:unnamed protein product, partial [Oppiella nova]
MDWDVGSESCDRDMTSSVSQIMGVFDVSVWDEDCLTGKACERQLCHQSHHSLASHPSAQRWHQRTNIDSRNRRESAVPSRPLRQNLLSCSSSISEIVPIIGRPTRSTYVQYSEREIPIPSNSKTCSPLHAHKPILDANKSPLVLLAKTCSSIGIDSPNNKPLILDKSKDHSAGGSHHSDRGDRKKTGSSSANSIVNGDDNSSQSNTTSCNSSKLSFKPYDISTKKSNNFSNNS